MAAAPTTILFTPPLYINEIFQAIEWLLDMELGTPPLDPLVNLLELQLDMDPPAPTGLPPNLYRGGGGYSELRLPFFLLLAL
jgi:hypothetical protein